MTDLNGKKVAFLATNGFEDSELTSPWEAVTEAGAQAVLISPESGTITGKKGHEAQVDVSSTDASAGDYDALVLPGGVANGDHLRMDSAAVSFTRDIFAQHKPVGVICHGGWILTDADVLRGRRMTSYPSLQTDLRNAGADWVDEEVVVDSGLVSSRTPKDLPAFNAKLVEEIGEGTHSRQTASAAAQG
ncbi:type 1 glutamine amidotransferase domain-containing protein [Ornithinicoccus halotolerans]|uniref:type 1 glutamine amidotransferase domain-containing protein n=1 Tax=Ornithinicoccus halotolerans TaxID=1748220 RepID=UPI001298227B|nr:type 1 glutamine amidotransferase domain-containing protein [Ornithinicoccus halotolerans]